MGDKFIYLNVFLILVMTRVDIETEENMAEENEEKCCTKYCRNVPSINYLGKLLCDECWQKQCGDGKNG